MCLILFSFHQHPTYKFILAANRDEFYARKTEPASFWPNHTYILGGRDVEAIRQDGTCGTWMAMTTSGKIAMITNYRDFKNLKTIAPSRGHLVTDFLIRDIDAESYLGEIESVKNNYNGFNVILGNVNNLFYLSNYRNGIDHLSAGFYGLSNHLLESPWPKVVLAKSKLESILKKSIIDPQELFEIMRDESHAPDDNLPNTGIGLDRERALSAMFIKTDGYGSRCSTVVLVTHSGEVIFSERTYNPSNFNFSTKTFEFDIKANG
jgi:uncharacterized protein with NRDE domain